MITRLLFFGVVTLTLVACPDSPPEQSTNVDSGEIIRSYSVDYDDTDKKMTYSAQFFKGSMKGRPIRLASDDMIRAQSLSLVPNSEFAAANALYNSEEIGPWTPEVEFSFVKGADKEITDSVQLAGRIFGFPSTITANVNVDKVVQFYGDPMQKDEIVEVYLEDTQGKKFFCDQKDILVDRFTISSKQLRFIRNSSSRLGDYQLHIKRTLEKFIKSNDPTKPGALHTVSTFKMIPADFIIY